MILMGHVQGTWPRRELFGDKRTFAARRPDTRAEDVDRMTIPKNSQSGFTLVELLIVIAVIGTLVAMLMPAINSARERGRQTVCASRMQQIGIALTKANANKGHQNIRRPLRGHQACGMFCFVLPPPVVLPQAPRISQLPPRVGGGAFANLCGCSPEVPKTSSERPWNTHCAPGAPKNRISRSICHWIQKRDTFWDLL